MDGKNPPSSSVYPLQFPEDCQSRLCNFSTQVCHVHVWEGKEETVFVGRRTIPRKRDHIERRRCVHGVPIANSKSSTQSVSVWRLRQFFRSGKWLGSVLEDSPASAHIERSPAFVVGNSRAQQMTMISCLKAESRPAKPGAVVNHARKGVRNTQQGKS